MYRNTDRQGMNTQVIDAMTRGEGARRGDGISGPAGAIIARRRQKQPVGVQPYAKPVRDMSKPIRYSDPKGGYQQPGVTDGVVMPNQDMMDASAANGLQQSQRPSLGVNESVRYPNPAAQAILARRLNQGRAGY